MYWAERETFRLWGFINLWKNGFITCLSALWTASSNTNNELNYSQLTAKLFIQAFIWPSLLINHKAIYLVTLVFILKLWCWMAWWKLEWNQTTPFSDTHAHTESCHQYCHGTVSVCFSWFETPLGGDSSGRHCKPAASFSWSTCMSVISSEHTKVITFSLFFFSLAVFLFLFKSPPNKSLFLLFLHVHSFSA